MISERVFEKYTTIYFCVSAAYLRVGGDGFCADLRSYQEISALGSIRHSSMAVRRCFSIFFSIFFIYLFSLSIYRFILSLFSLAKTDAAVNQPIGAYCFCKNSQYRVQKVLKKLYRKSSSKVSSVLISEYVCAYVKFYFHRRLVYLPLVQVSIHIAGEFIAIFRNRKKYL